MELKDYVRAFRAHPWMIVLPTVVLALVGGALGLMQEPTYDATIPIGLYAKTYPGDLLQWAGAEPLSSGQLVSPAFAKQPAIVEAAAEKAGTGISPGDLADRVTVSGDLEAGSLQIVASGRYEEETQIIAEAFAAAYLEHSADVERAVYERAAVELDRQLADAETDLAELQVAGVATPADMIALGDALGLRSVLRGYRNQIQARLGGELGVGDILEETKVVRIGDTGPAYYAVFGALFGLLVGLIAAAIVEHAAARIHEPADVSAVTGEEPASIAIGAPGDQSGAGPSAAALAEVLDSEAVDCMMIAAVTPMSGRAHEAASQFARALSRRGHDVTFLTLGDSLDTAEAPVFGSLEELADAFASRTQVSRDGGDFRAASVSSASLQEAANRDLEAAIRALADSCDRLVVSTPAVLEDALALRIARTMAVSVVLVDAHRTTSPELAQAWSALGRSGARQLRSALLVPARDRSLPYVGAYRHRARPTRSRS